jgi:hypothetical protein
LNTVRLGAAAFLLTLFVTRVAAAQPVAPPGPWVLDVRGATSGLPTDTAFFPAVATETLVPARGFGFDVGAHVYLLSLGPARVGVGASYLRARGTAESVTANVTTVAPQVSFNFGTTNGWSYLSAGLGRAWIKTTAVQLAGEAVRESAGLSALNFGGGARWFLASHVGFGFDVRWHRLSSTPGVILLSAAAGFSVH